MRATTRNFGEGVASPRALLAFLVTHYCCLSSRFVEYLMKCMDRAPPAAGLMTTGALYPLATACTFTLVTVMNNRFVDSHYAGGKVLYMGVV